MYKVLLNIGHFILSDFFPESKFFTSSDDG
jgi:hypothetical protein